MNPGGCLLLGDACGWIVGSSMQRSNQRDIMESMLAGGFGASIRALPGGLRPSGRSAVYG